MAKPENIAISKAEYEELIGYKNEANSYKKQVEQLKFELAEMKRMIFGSKRERFIPAENPGQKSLFEVEAVKEPEQPQETITYTRKKKQDKEKQQPLRTPLPEHLPHKREVIEPKDLPKGAKKIGESISRFLEYTPAELYVRVIVRPKFVVPQTNLEESPVIIAELPAMPIPKSNAGAGLLSHLLVSKYVDHLPFFRQKKIFKRQGIELAESTMNGWFNKSTQLLEYLYEAAKKKLLQADYLMADETPIPVLTKDKPGATHKGYLWVYYNPLDKLVIFDYRKTRSREGPNEILVDYKGHLQTDGYAGYDNLKSKSIILLACMAHARRYFDKAKGNDPERAEKALSMFQVLYDIERDAREQELDANQVKAIRQEKSIPILNKMEEWMKQEIYHVAPQSAIGKAFAYNLKLWPRLVRYTEDGRLHIDNNLIENSIRPVALGRKNYLFAGSHDAAKKTAIMYSLMAMCKINEVEPFHWLKSTLEKLPEYSAKNLHELLPGQK